MTDIELSASFDTVGLAYQLAGALSAEELVDFVRKLDEAASDWDFTVGVYRFVSKDIRTFYSKEIDCE